jgi:hypothetical protein
MAEIVNLKILDPHLQELLQAYGAAPERNPDSASRTRSKFLAELDTVFDAQLPSVPQAKSGFLQDWLALLRPPSLRRRAISYALTVLLVVGIFLSTGVGMTAYAASASLPGDALYPFKTTTENVRARWTPDPAAQAQLYLSFAGRRLVEMQALIREGRFADLDPAVREYERDVQGALRAIDIASRREAEALQESAAATLHGYSTDLVRLLVNVPMDAQPSLHNAIHFSEAAAGHLEGTASDDDDEGNLGGRGEDEHCRSLSPGNRDDDCGASPGEVGGRLVSFAVSPENESNNNSNNGSNNTGDDESNNDGNNSGASSRGGDDDDDDDDDDDGDDD